MRYCPKCLVKLDDFPEKENKEKDYLNLDKIYFKCPECEKDYEKQKALNFEQWAQLKFEGYEQRIEDLEKQVLKK